VFSFVVRIAATRFSLLSIIVFFSLNSCLFAKPVIGDLAGDFVFKYKIAGQVKNVPVYYFAPKKLTHTSRIVFILHGSARKGEVYRDEWRQYANKYNFLVLCPEFRDSEFPDWGGYNGGNIYDWKKKKYNPRNEWSFHVIEGLFDFVKKDRQMKVGAYCIFGHSAGAQFVHRMVLLMPEARFSLAIANGAGGYTEPTFDKMFPKGLRNTLANEESLRKTFEKDMVILMGDKDLVSKTMPRSSKALHKYDRVWMAKRFYERAKAEAEKREVKLNWRFRLVPNADHDDIIYAKYGSKYAAASKKNLQRPKVTSKLNN
jgi:hypothetical protein